MKYSTKLRNILVKLIPMIICRAFSITEGSVWVTASTSAMAVVTSGVAIRLMPNTIPPMASIPAQITTWVRPTRATPIILPSISSMGLHEEMMTSTMRLAFSSITPFIIIAPYISTNV